MSGKLSFPEGSVNDRWPSTAKSMIEKGQDPKDLLI